MEAKKDLNNTQRKMLDEIYTEQFKKKERKILDDRQIGLRKVREKVLKDEAKSKNIKAILDAGNTFTKLVAKHTEELKAKGLKISNLPYRDEGKFELELKDRYNDDIEHPDIVAYKEETWVIEENLAKVKKEMRAKIYGLNTTYEEVDKEIGEILKGIKL